MWLAAWWRTGKNVGNIPRVNGQLFIPIEFSPSSATWINALPVVASYFHLEYDG